MQTMQSIKSTKSSIHFLILGEDINDKLKIINDIFDISNTNKLFDIYIPDVEEPFTQYIYKNCIFTICPFSADIYKNINNDIFKNINGCILCFNDKSTIKTINILYNYAKLFTCKYKIMINFSSYTNNLFLNYNFHNYTLELFVKNIDNIIESYNDQYTIMPSCILL
jgi:hypothetical protein